MALLVKLICRGKTIEMPTGPQPMFPFAERLNCISLDSADGMRHTFNYGPTRVNASIVWRCVSYDKTKEYEDFLLKYTELGLHSFKIVCPEYLPLGLGKGIDIEEAYYSGPPTLKDVISLRGDAGLYYDIELPYMFVREK